MKCPMVYINRETQEFIQDKCNFWKNEKFSLRE